MAFIGLMAGSSCDGIDATVASFDSNNKITVHHSIHSPLPTDLVSSIKTLSHGCENELNQYFEMDHQLGHIFADSVDQLLQESSINANQVEAIGLHGVTIRHQPPTHSLQMGNAHILAQRSQCHVISDFRNRDISMGGQGAPLAPLFHHAFFYSASENRWILNLGGIANISLIQHNDNQASIGFDTGPANTLLNDWYQKYHTDRHYDHDGQWARSGSVIPSLLKHLRSDPFFQRQAPKSTSREHFNLDWVNHSIEQTNITYQPEDVQATLVELTASTISEAIMKHNQDNLPIHLFLCGGGAQNSYLVERIQACLQPQSINTCQALGVEPDFLEAIGFAWLAKAHLEKKRFNLQQLTGSKQACLLGTFYHY